MDDRGKNAVRELVKKTFAGIAPPPKSERTRNTFEAGFAAGVDAAAHAVPEAFIAVVPFILPQQAALAELAAEFDAGGDAERDADEPGIPSSVYYDCAEKARAALDTKGEQ